jgi:hypothetical protein
MRIVELTTAGALMLLSAYFMWHATVLPIGWDPATGPGGGAFPFWLSAGMFVCAAVIFVRQFMASPVGPAARRVFIHGEAASMFWVTIASMLAATALTPILGAYISIPAFLLGYTRYLGRQSWKVAAIIAVVTALFMFFFFEVSLKILLPKGVTEPLFIPLYAMFF